MLSAPLLGGCAPMPVDIRAQNALNLGQLEQGMSRERVLGIMGTGSEIVREGVYHEERLIGYVEVTVSNPYLSEMVTKDENRYEVLYFYALPSGMGVGPWDTFYSDRRIPVWYLTPVILKNGKYIGRGTDVLISEGLAESPHVAEPDPSILIGS
jgi:hypothetical protein